MEMLTRLSRISRLSHRYFSTTRLRSTNPRAAYEYVENVEDLSLYKPGGYHPVAIGDCFHRRYRVLHKLGHGAFSTIWLVKDQQINKNVALKIATADWQGQPRETGILSRLADLHHGSASGIPSLLDQFDLDGPNGTHRCLVMEAARCSLTDSKVASWIRLFPLQTARFLAAQLVTAVSHLHEHNYVHGDLHFGNVLVKLPSSFGKLLEQQINDAYDPPEPQPVIRQDGTPLPPNIPRHVYEAIWMGVPTEELTVEEARIMLTDFGVSFNPTEETRVKSYTPVDIRPPESRFEPSTPLTFSSDIWSLACAIWNLVAQRPIFGEILPTHDIITSQQINTLGQLPPEWWAKWDARLHFFTDDRVPLPSQRSPTWDERFERDIQSPRRERNLGMLNDEEREAFTDTLRWMLAYRPGDRPTAKEILQTKWMTEYALPCLLEL